MHVNLFGCGICSVYNDELFPENLFFKFTLTCSSPSSLAITTLTINSFYMRQSLNKEKRERPLTKSQSG